VFTVHHTGQTLTPHTGYTREAHTFHTAARAYGRVLVCQARVQLSMQYTHIAINTHDVHSDSHVRRAVQQAAGHACCGMRRQHDDSDSDTYTHTHAHTRT
jgi:hypothetical protein